MDFLTLIQLLDSTVRLATPLLLACLAGLFSERAGIFDIGLEGKMLAAAFFSAAVAALTGSVWIGLAAGIASSMAFSILHGLASITFRGNQLISGVAINFLAAGLTVLSAQDRFAEAATYAREKNSYSFLVWQNGAILHETYFEPFTADTRANSASMHKSVLALVIGAALDEGFIASVDDPAGTYIPEWADTPRGEITLKNLLQMASGLAPLSAAGGMTSPAALFVSEGEKARETVLGLQLIKAPGSEFHYANAVSQVLGLIVERATGQSYESYLQSRIWSKLDADSAYVWLNEADGFPRTYSSLMARQRL